jgi:isopenicillin N synthase-like dioxygenase
VPARIPRLDATSLFGGRTEARAATDAALNAAARSAGFVLIAGVPAEVPVGRLERARLLALFAAAPGVTRALWRQKFDPTHPNVYRGFFPLQPGNLTSKEGIDMGADVAYGAAVVVGGDPLREATPLPPEAALPGWREAVVRYYRGMESLSRALMRSLARGLELEEHFFDAAFAGGLSTLRLLRYPVRSAEELASCTDAGLWQLHAGERRYVTGAPHVDSGFLTVLAQDGVAGLQARHLDGSWLDVPPEEGTLAINFGRVLERWSGGRIRATEHRVIGAGAERHSIAYFHEARADALISPLPGDAADAFTPFVFGDYLWATITQFVEFRGMEALRQPTGRTR